MPFIVMVEVCIEGGRMVMCFGDWKDAVVVSFDAVPRMFFGGYNLECTVRTNQRSGRRTSSATECLQRSSEEDTVSY